LIPFFGDLIMIGMIRRAICVSFCASSNLPSEMTEDKGIHKLTLDRHVWLTIRIQFLLGSSAEVDCTISITSLSCSLYFFDVGEELTRVFYSENMSIQRLCVFIYLCRDMNRQRSSAMGPSVEPDNYRRPSFWYSCCIPRTPWLLPLHLTFKRSFEG